MKLIVQPGKEAEWTLPLLENPWNYLDGPVPEELEENYPFPAITARLRAFAERNAAGDPISQRDISRIFDGVPERHPQETTIRTLEALLRFVQEDGFMPSIIDLDETDEKTKYSVKLRVVPSDEFYVQPVFENGQRSSTRSLRPSRKPDLIQRIHLALPSGYGIWVGDDKFGCQYYLSTYGPSTEVFDVKVRGNSKEEIFRGIMPFISKKNYPNVSVPISSDETLGRQARFLLGMEMHTENTSGTYSRSFWIPKNGNFPLDKAKQEIGELVNMGIIREEGNGSFVLNQARPRYLN